MKMIIVIFVSFFGILFADNCYDSQKIWLVVRIDKKANIFETNKNWVADGNNLSLLSRKDSKWFARNDSSLITDDVLLKITGQKMFGEKLAQERESAKRRSSVQLAIGLPLGLGLLGGCAYWGSTIWDRETPSTIDLAGSLVLGIAGIGIVIGTISSYVAHHRAPDPKKHQISLKQASDIIDKYNEALQRKCQSSNSELSPSGR